MLNKIKVCIVITARPSYSRIRTAMLDLKKRASIELVVICSGSALLDRYGRISDVIKADGFDVVEELYTFVEGNDLINMSLTTANTITSTSLALSKLKPDYVVSIADRYETLGTAVAASYLSIPLIHIQGGEVTGNIDDKVRHAVTKLSDVHLVSSQSAKKRLIKMGENPRVIFNTGCPSIDIARQSKLIKLSEIQTALQTHIVGSNINIKKKFGVLLQHPETENFESSYDQMSKSLEAVSKTGIQILVFWPNVDAGSDSTAKAIRVFREKNDPTNIAFVKNLPGELFLRLLSEAEFLAGNSSVGLRECAFLGVPVVNIGDRQIGRDRSENVIDVECETHLIENALLKQISKGRYPSSIIYGDGYSGEKIANVICALKDIGCKRFYE
jgi:UDP-hydrolysing UDP-N-acetyl-D-glucosamine 2-epimerase